MNQSKTFTFKQGRKQLGAILLLSLIAQTALSAENKDSSPPPSTTGADAGEAIDVSKIQEKYWAQGKESELGVVQNRKYTSANKFEFGLLTGMVSTDPFLTVRSYGASLGYHFNQYLSVHAIGWKASVKDSDARAQFDAQVLTTNPTAGIDTNKPKFFYGLQGNYNFLYGKASLFGKLIIYVDIFALGGLGVTQTESGNNATPFVGIGQKIHLNQFFTLNLDYRIMRYTETILYKSGSNVGQFRDTRNNSTDVVTLGVSFLL